MKKILVPTDFTPASINALNYAADMALSIKAEMVILHVYQPPTSVYTELPLPPLEIERSLDEIDRKMLDLKAELVKRTNDQVPIKLVARVGNIRSDIMDMVNETDPLMVVMASHGAGKMERLLLGSNTIWASKHLYCPLVIVPRDAKFKKIAKIALAWNYRPLKDLGPLNKIRELVKEFAASLHVICIMKNASERLSNKLLAEANRFQEEFGDMNPHYSFIVDTDVTGAILEFSEKNQLDLVMVIPAKHDMLERIFHHSQSKDMALHTKWPLLSLHE
jgi:nucleotide-binding universal stress UspA family protein